MVPMHHYIEKLTYTSALRLYRLPRPSQLLCRLGLDWYVAGQGDLPIVTVSPSPQSQIEEEEKLHALRKYARDFRRQHTTDAWDFDWDLEDEDYGLAIGRLVVT
jgi:hypothetical protein